jgi:hypothetical protein
MEGTRAVNIRNSHRWIVGISLFFVLAATAWAEDGAASADDLAKRLNQGTVFDVVSLIHPDDRAAFAYAMSMQAASTLMGAPEGEATEKAKQEYGAILIKFRVNWPSENEPRPQNAADVAARTREMFVGVDIVGLAKALKAFTEDHAGGPQSLGNEGLGKLEDLKVEGNHGTAMIRGKAFTLMKAARGRWFLRLPTA